MGNLMRTGVAAGALVAALSGCSHGSAVLDHPAATATATRGASSPAASTMPGIDVQALWRQAVSRCSDPQVGDSPPADKNGFGVAAVWPTNEAVQQTVDGLRPAGDEVFTLDRLLDLRSAVLAVRFRLANTVIRGDRQVELAPSYGFDPQHSIDAVTRSVANFGQAWELDRAFITSEITTGAASQPTGDTTEAMSDVVATRESACQ